MQIRCYLKYDGVSDKKKNDKEILSSNDLQKLHTAVYEYISTGKRLVLASVTLMFMIQVANGWNIASSTLGSSASIGHLLSCLKTRLNSVPKK